MREGCGEAEEVAFRERPPGRAPTASFVRKGAGGKKALVAVLPGRRK